MSNFLKPKCFNNINIIPIIKFKLYFKTSETGN